MDKDKNIMWLLIPSFIGLFVSSISLAGLTLAWFKTSMNIENRNFVAGNFDVVAQIFDQSGSELTEEDTGYGLEEGTYTIRLSRSGTSMTSEGYALIRIGEFTYHTVPLSKENTIEFTVYTDTSLPLSFVPVWGSVENTYETGIDNSSRIEIIIKPTDTVTNGEEIVKESTQETNDETMTDLNLLQK